MKKKRYQIHYYNSLVSTQDTLKEFALHSAFDGTVIIADSQSAGRGRDGRNFYSPANTGIYMSILFRPPINALGLSPQKMIYITTAAAVAVCESIEVVTGKKVSVKWVNDIFYENSKISGILTEGILNKDATGYDFIVLGIGINIYTENFPENLRNIAGALYSQKPENVNFLKEKLIAHILNKLDFYYNKILSCDYRAFTDEYRKRSFVIGKNINIIVNDKIVDSGKVVSLNDDCSLNVTLENGQNTVLSFGEVRIKANEKSKN